MGKFCVYVFDYMKTRIAHSTLLFKDFIALLYYYICVCVLLYQRGSRLSHRVYVFISDVLPGSDSCKMGGGYGIIWYGMVW